MGSSNAVAAALYRARGLEFFEAMVFFKDDTKFGNTAALLAVHGAIALTDAVRMWYTGQRGKGEDHREAAIELDELCVAQNKNPDGCKHLKWLIDRKSKISYGEVRLRPEQDIKSAISHCDRFRNWLFKNFREVFQEAEE